MAATGTGTRVLLAACGVITAVLLMARMRDGDYHMPVGLRLPLPRMMRPDFEPAERDEPPRTPD